MASRILALMDSAKNVRRASNEGLTSERIRIPPQNQHLQVCFDELVSSVDSFIYVTTLSFTDFAHAGPPPPPGENGAAEWTPGQPLPPGAIPMPHMEGYYPMYYPPMMPPPQGLPEQENNGTNGANNGSGPPPPIVPYYIPGYPPLHPGFFPPGMPLPPAVGEIKKPDNGSEPSGEQQPKTNKRPRSSDKGSNGSKKAKVGEPGQSPDPDGIGIDDD